MHRDHRRGARIVRSCRQVSAWFVAGLLAGLLVGCGSTDGSRMPSFFSSAEHEKDALREEETHRQEFQTTRSKQAMRWLLAHRVQPGMSHKDVGNVLGEAGERQYNDRWLKGKATQYRIDDVLYRFGPDDEGNAIYLGFREDKLVNFDADRFNDDGHASHAKSDDTVFDE